LTNVGTFLQHPKLRFQWVRYLPRTSIADEFWGRLQLSLLRRIASERFFVTRNNHELRVAKDLRIVTSIYRDERGEPLVPDLNLGATAYISEKYDSTLDIPFIRNRGAADLSPPEFLSRLANDLRRDAPRLHSPASTASWHTKLADILINCTRGWLNDVKRLAIIPLTNGRWVVPLNASIFLPTSGGIEIPRGLPLNLVDAEALLDPTRRRLFSLVGVSECAPERIFPLIQQRSDGPLHVVDSCADVKFVFYHHEKLHVLNSFDMRLSTDTGSKVWSRRNSTGWTYCSQSNDRYAMSSIVGGALPHGLRGVTQFIHPRYCSELERCERRNNTVAVEWFRDFFCIKRYPQLHHREEPTRRSQEIEYIAIHHPGSILGALQVSWSQYHRSVDWDEYFQSIKVPVLFSSEARRLDSTWLPLPALVAIATRLGLQQSFGFLDELKDTADESWSQWSFLKRFGVGIEENLSFWLRLLQQAREKPNVNRRTIFEIYSHVQRFTAITEDANFVR
jgi:hypothetical protein